MKHLVLMMVLLLISCGSLQEKADDLYDLAIACNEHEKIPEENCKEEWAEWNKAEEHIIAVKKRRALKRGPKCPRGRMAYCDNFCMKDKPAERKWECISKHALQIPMRF